MSAESDLAALNGTVLPNVYYTGGATAANAVESNGHYTYSGTLDVISAIAPMTGDRIESTGGNYFNLVQSNGAITPWEILGTTADGNTVVFQYSENESLNTGPWYAFNVNGDSPNFGTISYNSDNSINLTVPCFVTDTLIRTVRGEVPIQDLVVGEDVLTISGEAVTIRWIGHHTVRCDHCFDPTAAWPIRICAGAFGEHKPYRDLFVSPGHAVWVPFLEDGVLIPASSLVNGSSIAQIEDKTVTYWHVELATHDILLANGLPAESYVDVGNRSFFTSTDSHVAPGDAHRTTTDYCRPFFKDGLVVQAVWQALKTRAFALGWTLEQVTKPRMFMVADDVIIHPAFDNQKARFILPANVRDAWLVSETSIPYHVMDIPDHRRLGVRLDALSISDGLGVHRQIALDDRLLCTGFHLAEEEGTRRWTAGRARLPAELWQGCRDIVIVQIGFLGPLPPRWVEPSKNCTTLSPSFTDTKAARVSAATL